MNIAQRAREELIQMKNASGSTLIRKKPTAINETSENDLRRSHRQWKPPSSAGIYAVYDDGGEYWAAGVRQREGAPFRRS
jgi:hypothetical protein